jgi:hypothetical protein
VLKKILQQLKRWYSSSAKLFPDGTKMRLIPPYNSLITFGQKSKYSSLVAWQAALNTRISTGSTWELSANLILNNLDLVQGFMLRQILLSIPSQVFPGKPLFHSVDRLWRSQTGITFTFLPENEEDARSYIAGLVPYLKDSADPCFMKFFLEEAKLQHMNSKWDRATRQAYSADEAELEDLLADDDEMNKSDEPTLQKREGQVEVNIPQVSSFDRDPALYKDNNSVSTFNSKPHAPTYQQPSMMFTPRILNPPTEGGRRPLYLLS